jgi:NAD(P)-dependent dehydrogenase (short-subunit alcohol dehydrogenase family)
LNESAPPWRLRLCDLGARDAARTGLCCADDAAGGLGEQGEVGALIAFLASGQSPFTTGQVVYFTGGWPS